MSKPQDFIISTSAPGECDLASIAAFQALVLEGGEVDPVSLPALVKRALVLAFVQSGNSLVGVAGIKRPNNSHRGKVFAKAKSGLSPATFGFELGWVYLKPVARNKRLISPIIRKLLPALNSASVYATSRVNNTSMHTSLSHCGFCLEGVPYPSKMNEPNIQLFVHK